MGRFISPDTIVPNPANPQALNRYSYCLNNPLKYVDPSGFNVEINGWDVDVINAFLNSSITLPGELGLEIWEVINSSLYQAYLEFRDKDPILTKTLETSTRTIDISFGNTNPNGSRYTPNSTFTRNGDDRSIIINSNHSQANSFWLADQVYIQCTDFVDMFAPLVNQETGWDLLGFIPVGKAIKQIPNVGGDWSKYYQAFESTFGYGESISEATRLNGSGEDALVTAFSTTLSLSPWWFIGAGVQLAWDIYKAGTQFYEDVDARGGVYQFKP